LEDCIEDQLRHAQSDWRLADILTYTKFSDRILEATKREINTHLDWSTEGLVTKLQMLADAKGHLESRNRRMATNWIAALQSYRAANVG
jgi:hypothetical protein